MVDIQGVSDLLGSGFAILRNHLPPDRLPENPGGWAALLIPLGVVLALWGARLLKTAYVLGFMAAGAAVGLNLARANSIDQLIGLFLGAGLAGLVGHFLFRWWVGATAAICAVLLVTFLSASKPVQMLKEYEEHRLGMSSGTYALPAAPADSEVSLVRYLEDFRTFLLQNKQDFVYKSAFVLGLAGLLGLGIGILLPRLTMIVGTSCVGVITASTGLGGVLSSKWPDAWGWAAANAGWCLGAAGVLLVASMLFQARKRRTALPVPAPLPAAA